MLAKFHGISLADQGYIEKMRVENLASDPTAVAAGRIWYNSTDGKLKYTEDNGAGGLNYLAMVDEAELDALRNQPYPFTNYQFGRNDVESVTLSTTPVPYLTVVIPAASIIPNATYVMCYRALSVATTTIDAMVQVTIDGVIVTAQPAQSNQGTRLEFSSFDIHQHVGAGDCTVEVSHYTLDTKYASVLTSAQMVWYRMN